MSLSERMVCEPAPWVCDDVQNLEATNAELCEEVQKLKAINAELLKGLEAIENGVKIGLPMGEIWHIAKKYRKAARAVIAKAKGEQP